MTIDDLISRFMYIESDMLVSEPAVTMLRYYQSNGAFSKYDLSVICKEYDELLNETLNGLKASLLIEFALQSINVGFSLEPTVNELDLYKLPEDYVKIYQSILHNTFETVSNSNSNIGIPSQDSNVFTEKSVYRLDFNVDNRKHLYFYTFDISNMSDSNVIDVVFFDYFGDDASIDFAELQLLPISFRYKGQNSDFAYVLRIFDVQSDFYNKYKVSNLGMLELSSYQFKTILAGQKSQPIRDPWNVHEDLLINVMSQKIEKYFKLCGPT
jgi:hypothetical protein